MLSLRMPLTFHGLQSLHPARRLRGLPLLWCISASDVIITAIRIFLCTSENNRWNSVPPGTRLFMQISRMTLLSEHEFEQMEHLLADLLTSCDEREEANLLGLHARLQAIFEQQKALNSSRKRLKALQSQTGR